MYNRLEPLINKYKLSFGFSQENCGDINIII